VFPSLSRILELKPTLILELDAPLGVAIFSHRIADDLQNVLNLWLRAQLLESGDIGVFRSILQKFADLLDEYMGPDDKPLDGLCPWGGRRVTDSIAGELAIAFAGLGAVSAKLVEHRVIRHPRQDDGCPSVQKRATASGTFPPATARDPDRRPRYRAARSHGTSRDRGPLHIQCVRVVSWAKAQPRTNAHVRLITNHGLTPAL